MVDKRSSGTKWETERGKGRGNRHLHLSRPFKLYNRGCAYACYHHLLLHYRDPGPQDQDQDVASQEAKTDHCRVVKYHNHLKTGHF